MNITPNNKISVIVCHALSRMIIGVLKVKVISLFTFSIEVDITGTSTLKPEEENATVENKTLIEQLASWNPCFSSLEGNPHSQVVNEDE